MRKQMVETLELQKDVTTSPFVLALREELANGDMRRLDRVSLGELDAEICAGRDSLWVIVRRPGKGGLALRAAYLPTGKFECRAVAGSKGEPLQFEVDSALGRHRITVRVDDADLQRLRVTIVLRPALALCLPFLPRDLYLLSAGDDPLDAKGNVEAAQRGVNSGLVYLRLREPAFGSLLYFQNLTALNPYMRATGTTPDGVVGGLWPELGYLPPVRKTDTGEADPLPAGEDVVLSDAILVFCDEAEDDEQEMARQFLRMLGTAYKALELPAFTYRDWLWRVDRTLEDLEAAPEAIVRHYGHRYVMPYVQGEVPDVMVQMSVIASLHDFGKWRGEPLPLAAELMAGMDKFYDPEVKTLRRYLPDVGADKDPDAVDSWYLYHPMINMARIAIDGDQHMRELLLKSVDYGIRAAHHFEYKWPILYKMQDFAVITKARDDDRFGQTDVNGIYAYLMVQLHELTGEQRYLDEASASIAAAKGLRFDLMYQANLTVWGAVACMRLWRITGDEDYLSQSYVYLAALFHNCEIWESEIGAAEHYRNFLGATCLHDAPYMAMYECFECFAGFEEYLANSGAELEPAARMLISEYCKYGLDRAWFYYPDALPEEIIHKGDHQSGIIDPKLSFPLEDLYGDGQAPGQIGQEIYGCGAAFVFASRSFHEIEGAPFRLFSSHFIRGMERTGERSVALELIGGETCVASISVIGLEGQKPGKIWVATTEGDRPRPHAASEDRIEFHVPAQGRLILSWE
jgi:hypothetical protein